MTSNSRSFCSCSSTSLSQNAEKVKLKNESGKEFSITLKLDNKSKEKETSDKIENKINVKNNKLHGKEYCRVILERKIKDVQNIKTTNKRLQNKDQDKNIDCYIVNQTNKHKSSSRENDEFKEETKDNQKFNNKFTKSLPLPKILYDTLTNVKNCFCENAKNYIDNNLQNIIKCKCKCCCNCCKYEELCKKYQERRRKLFAYRRKGSFSSDRTKENLLSIRRNRRKSIFKKENSENDKEGIDKIKTNTILTDVDKDDTADSTDPVTTSDIGRFVLIDTDTPSKDKIVDNLVNKRDSPILKNVDNTVEKNINETSSLKNVEIDENQIEKDVIEIEQKKYEGKHVQVEKVDVANGTSFYSEAPLCENEISDLNNSVKTNEKDISSIYNYSPAIMKNVTSETYFTTPLCENGASPLYYTPPLCNSNEFPDNTKCHLEVKTKNLTNTHGKSSRTTSCQTLSYNTLMKQTNNLSKENAYNISVDNTSPRETPFDYSSTSKGSQTPSLYFSPISCNISLKSSPTHLLLNKINEHKLTCSDHKHVYQQNGYRTNLNNLQNELKTCLKTPNNRGNAKTLSQQYKQKYNDNNNISLYPMPTPKASNSNEQKKDKQINNRDPAMKIQQNKNTSNQNSNTYSSVPKSVPKSFYKQQNEPNLNQNNFIYPTKKEEDNVNVSLNKIVDSLNTFRNTNNVHGYENNNSHKYLEQRIFESKFKQNFDNIPRPNPYRFNNGRDDYMKPSFNAPYIKNYKYFSEMDHEKQDVKVLNKFSKVNCNPYDYRNIEKYDFNAKDRILERISSMKIIQKKYNNLTEDDLLYNVPNNYCASHVCCRQFLDLKTFSHNSFNNIQDIIKKYNSSPSCPNLNSKFSKMSKKSRRKSLKKRVKHSITSLSKCKTGNCLANCSSIDRMYEKYVIFNERPCNKTDIKTNKKKTKNNFKCPVVNFRNEFESTLKNCKKPICKCSKERKYSSEKSDFDIYKETKNVKESGDKKTKYQPKHNWKDDIEKDDKIDSDCSESVSENITNRKSKPKNKSKEIKNKTKFDGLKLLNEFEDTKKYAEILTRRSQERQTSFGKSDSEFDHVKDYIKNDENEDKNSRSKNKNKQNEKETLSNYLKDFETPKRCLKTKDKFTKDYKMRLEILQDRWNSPKRKQNGIDSVDGCLYVLKNKNNCPNKSCKSRSKSCSQSKKPKVKTIKVF